MRPGDPITIGPPFANVTYVVLERGGLRPLPHGEIGELCIGGMHVARGYRNLPELTAEKFITHPEFGRLYRTGDKCKIEIQTQRVHFLGRIDTQLKVRGHRVEMQAVEDILQTQFKEIEAAVLDYQNETLVAFVAAPSICPSEIPEVAPAPAQWAARVTAKLAEQLPPRRCQRASFSSRIRDETHFGKDRPGAVAEAGPCVGCAGVGAHMSGSQVVGAHVVGAHILGKAVTEQQDVKPDVRVTACATKAKPAVATRRWISGAPSFWRSAGRCSEASWEPTIHSLRLAGTHF